MSCGLHLVVKDLGLAGFSLGNERLVEDLENILAHFLQLILDLLAIVTNDANVLLRALGFLLLLNGGDDSPRSTTGAHHILVSDGEQVTLVDGKFASQLIDYIVSWGCRYMRKGDTFEKGSWNAYVGDFLNDS